MPFTSTHLFVALLTAGLGVSASAKDLPPHPRLLFNQAGIEQFKAKVLQKPWSDAWAKQKAVADKRLAKPVELPPRGGNWHHNYICPEHGLRLQQGKQLGPWQWEHHCAVGPHTLQGDASIATLDFDGWGIANIHSDCAAEIRDLGLLYRVTGDRRYAERTRAILLAYAEQYLSYPMHNNQGKPVDHNGGRVASQPLSEATWLIPVVQGADLVWDTLAAADRTAVEKKLLRPALDETIRNKAKKPVIHNIQCHRNSAVGLVGLLLDDKELITEAIDGPSGYRANMREGVKADGAWYEGAWGYHFYTLRGCWPLVEAARNCGIDLYGEPLRRMFDAPLALAMPNLKLPAFNDSSEVDIASSADMYELALARYGSPAYAAIVGRKPRIGQLALWYGMSELPAGTTAALGSRNSESSGYAVLQQGSGASATWLCQKYGPHGGGHGHPDKNSFVLYSRGGILMPDAGTRSYGSPLHKTWDRATFVHNTLVVDERSQAETTGKCLVFGSQAGAEFVMTDAGATYPGVRFVRTATLLAANLLVVVDQVLCDKPHTLDIVCHHLGKWGNLPQGKAFDLPKTPGYMHLRNATTRPSAGCTGVNVRRDDKEQSRIVLAGNEPTDVITATGVGKSTEDRVPVVIFRRQATQTTFVWCVAIDGAEVNGSVTSVAGGQKAAVAVVRGKDAWELKVDSAAGAVLIAKPTHAQK